MGDVIVLDLETKKSFDEIGGRDHLELLEVSLCGVYSYARKKFRAFREEEFAELEEWLKEAEMIVGFNSKYFDFTVLQPYLKLDLKTLPHTDILEEITNKLGHRLKLESLAMSTIGEGKSGSGLDAIWYYKNNEWDKLAKYCLVDVRVTKEVYEYGQRHGNLWYEMSGKRMPIPISWGTSPTIIEKLNNAYRSGDKLEIEYLKTDNEERGKLEIDIKGIKNNQLQAYCHNSQGLKVLNIEKIFKVKSLGKASNWQNKLF
jgi:DEAD/DEAH box helicase domain-containing protein